MTHTKEVTRVKTKLTAMKEQMLHTLPRTLSFWEERAWDPEKEIILTLGCDNRPLGSGQRSAVLVSRVLWAFSSAYRLTGDRRWLTDAARAYTDLREHFADPLYGGIYEELSADGRVSSDEKRIYTQSYAIYGLSEYSMAAAKAGQSEVSAEAEDWAFKILTLIEQNGYSAEKDGYVTACTRMWTREKGNFAVDTYLHLTESYTNYLKCTQRQADPCREALRKLVESLCTRWLRPEGALYQTLTEEWLPAADLSDRFADDAECAWMITEAVEQIGESALTEQVRASVQKIMQNMKGRGYDSANGGVFDRYNQDGRMDTDKMWWEESESVTGLLYGYRMLGETELAEKAAGTWDFLQQHMIREDGSWNWKVGQDGRYIIPEDPSDPLMCPYHSVRVITMCVPLIDNNSK